MRDPRLDALAGNLLDHSLGLRPGEKVLIEGEAGSLDLMIALVEAAYERGAVPFVDYGDPRLRRAWLLGATREQMDLRSAWETQRVGDVDAALFIMAGDNASELADVPAATLGASRLANEALMNLYLTKKWVLLRYPTAAAAQAAGMSTEAFEDFCLAVCSLDYARMDKAMDPLVELMSKTDRVRVTSPGTDIAFSIKGIPDTEGGRHQQHPRRRGLHGPRARLGQRHRAVQHPLAGGRHHLRAGAADPQGRPHSGRRRQRTRAAQPDAGYRRGRALPGRVRSGAQPPDHAGP